MPDTNENSVTAAHDCLMEIRDDLIRGRFDKGLPGFFSFETRTVIIAGQKHRLSRYYASLATIIQNYEENKINAQEALQSIDELYGTQAYRVIKENNRESRCALQ